LRGSAKALAEMAGDVHGETVLEIGGGVGAIELELLSAGAARATNAELAATYEHEAASLASERGVEDRVERRVGDFVAEADAFEPHDVVVMHRVVCCYPDLDALVGAAAARAKRSLVLTYPQERRIVRSGVSAMNAAMHLFGTAFTVYVHPPARMAAVAGEHGLALSERRRHGLLWESAAYARAG